jgi:hypothetical protein
LIEAPDFSIGAVLVFMIVLRVVHLHVVLPAPCLQFLQPANVPAWGVTWGRCSFDEVAVDLSGEPEKKLGWDSCDAVSDLPGLPGFTGTRTAESAPFIGPAAGSRRCVALVFFVLGTSFMDQIVIRSF